MGCTASKTNEKATAGGSPRRVGVGDSYKYEPAASGTDNKSFAVDTGYFRTNYLIKLTDTPAESLRVCTVEGQADRQVCLKAFRREALEENPVKLEQTIEASRVAHDFENHYLLRLFHSFHSPTFRTWYLVTNPYAFDIVHLMSLNYRSGFDLETASRIGAEIVSGLDCLHKQGMVHGDLRAANVLITPSGHVRISMYPSYVLATGPNDIYALEDVLYDAPDGSSGSEDEEKVLSPKDDWWAFGCILYEILHGQALFRMGANENLNEDTESVQRAKSTNPVKVPESNKMASDSPMFSLIKNLLNHSAVERFDSEAIFSEPTALNSGQAAVDWKNVEYFQGDACIDVETLAGLAKDNKQFDDSNESWETEVSFLDRHHQTEAQEGLDEVLMGVLVDEGDEDIALKKEEERHIESLCSRWDMANTVDKLSKFSLNLKAEKFDKFVAYGSDVKAKTGRVLDAENAKQFEMLKSVVEKNPK
jgi:serine/threonine protein kinase